MLKSVTFVEWKWWDVTRDSSGIFCLHGAGNIHPVDFSWFFRGKRWQMFHMLSIWDGYSLLIYSGFIWLSHGNMRIIVSDNDLNSKIMSFILGWSSESKKNWKVVLCSGASTRVNCSWKWGKCVVDVWCTVYTYIYYVCIIDFIICYSIWFKMYIKCKYIYRERDKDVYRFFDIPL